MTFLAAQAGGHPPGCPHRAGLILSKKEKKNSTDSRLCKNPNVLDLIPQQHKSSDILETFIG